MEKEMIFGFFLGMLAMLLMQHVDTLIKYIKAHFNE